MYEGTQNRAYQISGAANNRMGILYELRSNNTNVDELGGLESQVDGCSYMSCGCFKSAWTIVLSPAGIAAGMAAAAAAAVL